MGNGVPATTPRGHCRIDLAISKVGRGSLQPTCELYGEIATRYRVICMIRDNLRKGFATGTWDGLEIV